MGGINEREIRIVPYTEVDGIYTYRDSDIKALYNKVYTDGAGETVFFDGSIKDADHFVNLMKSPHTFLHIIYVDKKIVAMAWINRIELTHCYCHWLFFKEAWRDSIIYDVGQYLLNYLVHQYGFEVIMGITPQFNKLALRYLTRLGLESLGTIPGILYSAKEESAIPGTFMYITKEMLE